MEIKLSSVQMIEALNLGISKSTFVAWTHRGFVKGTRTTNGKRGGNFTYSMEELKRIKSVAKQFGVNNLPESLADNYVPKEPKVKINIPKTEITDMKTLDKILRELQEIKKISLDLWNVWNK